MRLFLYGTLLDPDTLARCGGDAALPTRLRAAVLYGWRRVTLRGTPYPTLRREPGGRVDGALLDAPASVVVRLMAYEGAGYRLTRVVVALGRENTVAHAWIAAGATRRDWPESRRA
jgi:gamma-glutamylcyclotransferase (GGCT)/AIG2-like uncharacterized protein YtfP